MWFHWKLRAGDEEKYFIICFEKFLVLVAFMHPILCGAEDFKSLFEWEKSPRQWVSATCLWLLSLRKIITSYKSLNMVNFESRILIGSQTRNGHIFLRLTEHCWLLSLSFCACSDCFIPNLFIMFHINDWCHQEKKKKKILFSISCTSHNWELVLRSERADSFL